MRPTPTGEPVIVETQAGAVRGLWRTHSAAFLGIPFAEPPFGDLRFQAPAGRAPWTGVRDALAYAPTPQRKALAEITTIPSDRRRITEQLIKSLIATAGELSRRPGHWWSDQLQNRDGEAGYLPLGEEMWRQSGERVDALVHSVGTAHSIHGTASALRRHNPRLRVVAVEPSESAVLSGRSTGAHQIEGIGIGFLPPLWRRDEVDEIETVSTPEAKEMARRLAREEGIFAGTSSGGNIVVALRVASRFGPDATVGTIIVDSGLRYLSTDVFQA